MEKEFDYQFKKMYSYVDTSILKNKEVNGIMMVLGSGRFKELIKFEGYGVCEYDENDKQLMNPHVTMIEKFNRLRTNVLVYDIFNNGWSKGKYNKLFIFKTNWAKDPTYGFVMYNTETNEFMHYHEIEYAYDILAQDIMKTFNTLHKQNLLNFCKNKYVCTNTGNYNEFTTEDYYNELMDEYKSAQWGDENVAV